jgi:EAL domain-containing protein (putative c-di-GMP-specific phosphodiesterase class I)
VATSHARAEGLPSLTPSAPTVRVDKGRTRTNRSDSDLKVAELLRTAKEALGLSLTFLSRLDGQVQHLEVVESSIPLFRDGQTQPQATSFCQAILDGKLPNVIPNVAKLPEAKRLPAARFPRIRSFVSVPVRLSDGTLYGTFCAAGFIADKELTKRDRALMEVLASAAATIIEPGVQERNREAKIRARLQPILNAGGPNVVLQPIVALANGVRVGAEALSRFPAEWGQPPDEVFLEAASIGIGVELELWAIRRAVRYLPDISGYLAINLSAATLLDDRCIEVLGELPAERILLELSEHDAVEDYDGLSAALDPFRARGMRLAIDDVGAGFSSLRHIVLSAPDVIKLDRSIVAGVATDRVLHRLVRSLVDFGHEAGAAVVAEGIETSDDASALRNVGVDYGQGWYFGRPGTVQQLDNTRPAEDLLSRP